MDIHNGKIHLAFPKSLNKRDLFLAQDLQHKR